MEKFNLIKFVIVCFLVCIAIFLVFSGNSSIIFNIIGIIYSYGLYLLFTKTKIGKSLIKGYLDLYRNLLSNLGMEE